MRLGDSAPLLRGVILFLVCLTAIAVRLFAVVRYESVIHEFDPYVGSRGLLGEGGSLGIASR